MISDYIHLFIILHLTTWYKIFVVINTLVLFCLYIKLLGYISALGKCGLLYIIL